VLDIVRKPALAQLEKIAELGTMVEYRGGVVIWQVINHNDTGTPYEGEGVLSLLDVLWYRLKSF
jgi:hypothetical protein